MNSQKGAESYVAFLRGINVGGHHKVPMADLRSEMEVLGFKNVLTLLNSGNVIFDSAVKKNEDLEEVISGHLEKIFGFPVPTIIRKSKTICKLFETAPFRDVKIDKDIRLYVSFLKKNTQSDLEFPWSSTDDSYKILDRRDQAILSILDLSVSKTPQAMAAVEKFFGSDITTRNWKTIERIVNKLQVDR
ncbi:MAG: DUF1697 domain-containing protein [Aurantibacter sp.]